MKSPISNRLCSCVLCRDIRRYSLLLFIGAMKVLIILAVALTACLAQRRNSIQVDQYQDNQPAESANQQYQAPEQQYQNQDARSKSREITTPIPIIRYDKEQGNDGSYKAAWETGNNILAQEEGFLKPLGPDPDEEGGILNAQVQQGSYSYTAPDGQIITVNYIADEKGFHPTGDHLPTPPPVSAEVQKGLDLIFAGIKAQQSNGTDPDFIKIRKNIYRGNIKAGEKNLNTSDIPKLTEITDPDSSSAPKLIKTILELSKDQANHQSQEVLGNPNINLQTPITKNGNKVDNKANKTARVSKSGGFIQVNIEQSTLKNNVYNNTNEHIKPSTQIFFRSAYNTANKQHHPPTNNTLIHKTAETDKEETIFREGKNIINYNNNKNLPKNNNQDSESPYEALVPVVPENSQHIVPSLQQAIQSTQTTKDSNSNALRTKSIESSVNNTLIDNTAKTSKEESVFRGEKNIVNSNNSKPLPRNNIENSESPFEALIPENSQHLVPSLQQSIQSSQTIKNSNSNVLRTKSIESSGFRNNAKLDIGNLKTRYNNNQTFINKNQPSNLGTGFSVLVQDPISGFDNKSFQDPENEVPKSLNTNQTTSIVNSDGSNFSNYDINNQGTAVINSNSAFGSLTSTALHNIQNNFAKNQNSETNIDTNSQKNVKPEASRNQIKNSVFTTAAYNRNSPEITSTTERQRSLNIFETNDVKEIATNNAEFSYTRNIPVHLVSLRPPTNSDLTLKENAKNNYNPMSSSNNLPTKVASQASADNPTQELFKQINTNIENMVKSQNRLCDILEALLNNNVKENCSNLLGELREFCKESEKSNSAILDILKEKLN